MSISDAQLAELYRDHAHVLRRRCLAILGNEEEAMDAVQETFARVIIHYDSFRQDASPLTWMYRISTNHCLNVIRNRKRRRDKRALHRDAIVGEGVDPGGSGAWEAEATFRRLIEDEDDQTRAMVIHLFFDDMTRAETARMLGVSLPTLRKRLRKFLARARKQLEPHGVTLAVSTVVLLLGFMIWMNTLPHGGTP